MMTTNRRDPAYGSTPPDPAGRLADQQSRSAEKPALTELELEEIAARIGRGVRAMASETLIDPVPREFQRLLESLEQSERSLKR